jgi:hypothetical protein
VPRRILSDFDGYHCRYIYNRHEENIGKSEFVPDYILQFDYSDYTRLHEENMAETKYTEESIKSLNWREHIRLRPGMYIGKLGDGSAPDDGIYVLLKETIDNSIDEFLMGYGKRIDVSISEQRVRVQDYGRGIPLGKVYDCVAKINTGGNISRSNPYGMKRQKSWSLSKGN